MKALPFKRDLAKKGVTSLYLDKIRVLSKLHIIIIRPLFIQGKAIESSFSMMP
jgi:hypothetical protein